MLMWIGAFVFLLGFIFLILGARLSSIVESGIVEKVEEKLTVSTSSEQDSKFMTSVQPYTLYVFNVTNAKQVVENGSVPIVQQIQVALLIFRRDVVLGEMHPHSPKVRLCSGREHVWISRVRYL